MFTNKKLSQSFYARPARTVAQDILGKRLVRVLDDGTRLSGKIVEVEAYCDSVEPDLACHASKNGGKPTARTAVMFGPPAHVFIYFTYGMHWMFNIVTGEEGVANALLVRAIEPDEGEPIMAANRNYMKRRDWTNGPAKITRAMNIDKQFNGANLCGDGGVIWLEDAPTLAASEIGIGPRVGMGKTPEPWFSMPWRYWVKDNPFVSKYR